MSQYFDVFNGDADGLCAIHQMRLADAIDSQLITGVKRNIRLLSQVNGEKSDCVTAFDICFAENRTDVERLLANGVRVRYFDHHYAGTIPKHPLFEPHIDVSPGVCTSIIVDRFLGGRFRLWAIVGAFGDNLSLVARELAASLSLSEKDIERLRVLGECLNYNSYGESEDDLYYRPAALYRAMAPFADPFEFLAGCPHGDLLRFGMRSDLESAQRISPTLTWAHGDAYVLPAECWARRAGGVFANRLVQIDPDGIHAVLIPNAKEGYLVNLRVPPHASITADALCREFPTGGGRAIAAGINHLSEADLQRFFDRLQAIALSPKP